MKNYLCIIISLMLLSVMLLLWPAQLLAVSELQNNNKSNGQQSSIKEKQDLTTKELTTKEKSQTLPEEQFVEEGDEQLDQIGKIYRRVLRIVEARNPEKVLFVVALENVLIVPFDKEFYATKQDLQVLIKRALSAVRESKMGFINELILTEYPQAIIDPRVIELLNELQKRRVPIIVVTKNVSGKFNKIQYLEQWTAEFLKKTGFDLAKGQFAGIRLIMDKFLQKKRDSFPTFFDGLLSCSFFEGTNAEQTVLTTLLVRFNYTPSTLMMLHNDSSVLAVVEKQIHEIKPDIEYWPFKFEFTPVEQNDLKPEPFLKFWKQFAQKLNSISRGAADYDAGNPYEEE